MSENVTGFSSDSSGPPLPRVFGRLILLKLVARGGMGDIYLAATTGIEGAERPCVVKTVRRDHIHDGSFLARFLDEARVQAQLNHPGVAQILEAATDDQGEPYTVVEYVEGRSLADVRQRAIQLGAKVGWPEAVAIAIEMGQALAHVHERAGSDGTPLGIVHRDLSPQNVMIGFQGEVKLIDFGTARGHNRRCHTVAGVVFAKPGYVAPEVARQQVGDGRIDVFALGVMLWELCAGKRLIEGDAQKYLEACAAGENVIPRLAGLPDFPPELDRVIQKLTANDPDERYPSAGMAAMDLGRVLATAPTGKNGERSVRARIHTIMKVLWPHEPGRSRSEFARLLKQASDLRGEVNTPPASRAMEIAAQHMDDDPSVLSGTPYRLGAKIGQGASGIVYEAEHVELGRKYAVKVLSLTHGSAHDSIERFRREARAVAHLNHPNLVCLHDFGRSIDGRVFLAMELLQGQSLDKHLKDARPARGGMNWREAVRLGIEATKALEAAHGAGLVHRDLKPANLFLTDDGTLKLLDFGVAMALSDVGADGQEKRQRGFAIFGTPEYMAPEQVAGEPLDARSDIYSLGCVLYELVTGERPFVGGSSVVIMGKQLREMPESPRACQPAADIPEELDQIILRALAKAPADRFESATAMREALSDLKKVPIKTRAKVQRSALLVLMGACAFAVVPAMSVWKPAGERAEAPFATPAPEATIVTTEPEPAMEPKTVMPMPPATSTAEPIVAIPSGTVATTAAPAALAAIPDDERGRRLEGARHAAKLHASDPRALKGWATAAYRAGELKEARRASEAWSLRDGTAEPRMFLATVLDASNRRSEAKVVLEEWLQLHPESTEARRMHARLGAPLSSDGTSRKSQLARR